MKIYYVLMAVFFLGVYVPSIGRYLRGFCFAGLGHTLPPLCIGLLFWYVGKVVQVCVVKFALFSFGCLVA